MTVKTRADFKSGYATTLADNTAGDITAADLRGELEHLADSARFAEDLGSAATSDAGDFATAAQGALADSAVQPGAHVSSDAGNTLTQDPKHWVGSQADYDALGTYDANTIYDVVS